MIPRELRFGAGGPNGTQEVPRVMRRSKMECKRLSWNIEVPSRARDAQVMKYDVYHP